MDFQQEELNEILNIFQQESSEIILSMDAKLLALEHDNKNKDIAMQLFRDAHSLKGSCRMLGFNNIQNIAHKIEDVISLVREDKLLMTVKVADTVSECLNFIMDLINKTVHQKEEFNSPDIKFYIEKLEKLFSCDNDNKEIKPDLNETNNDNSIETPINPDIVEEDKIEEIIQKIPLMEINSEFSKETSDLVKNLLEKENNEKFKKIYSTVNEIAEIFIEKKLSMPHDIALGLKEAMSASKLQNEDLINEAIEKIDVIKTMAKFQYSEKKPLDKHLETTQKDILTTISNSEIKTLRVDSIKLDTLVGQVDELIVSKIKTNEQLALAKKITNDLHEWQKNSIKMGYHIKNLDKKLSSIENNLSVDYSFDYKKVTAYSKQLCSLATNQWEKMASLIKETDNLFKQLQESETKLNSTANEIETMVKNMRVVPLSTIFQLFPRMVHNIAADKNKKIDLVIEGGNITADKTIIEEIKIPLMHIIRNSIDHGIEDVGTRTSLGKSPKGRIEIIASYVDNKVVIDIKDDGRGLDVEKIRKKALEKKILDEEELSKISDDELTNLIFLPGFSTESFVTEISGRGLGLDIVNNKINELQGRIDIFSRINLGTVVRIVLPTAIATKKAFIIEEQNQLFAMETSVIKTIVRIHSDEIFEKDENNYFIFEGAAIPVYTLSQILNFENVIKETDKHTLLIMETENNTFGIIVEKLISDQVIVHKKLAPPLYKVKNISGITTLTNGDGCLILNVSDIISSINSSKIGTKIISKNGILETKDNSKFRILIVDDSHTTRILQKNILSNQGYNVTTATNAIIALEKLKQNNFDLIISDIQMPEMNGFEFISNLRKMPDYVSCPIIVVSSEKEEKYTQQINENKVVKFIQKNTFKQEELIKTVENILRY